MNDIRVARALKVLAGRPRCAMPFDDDDHDVVFDSMVGSVDKVIGFVRQYHQLETPVVVGGSTIRLKIDNLNVEWLDRFRQIIDGSQSIARQHDVDWHDLAKKLIRADGWCVDLTVRTPTWMRYRELPVAEFERVVGMEIGWLVR